MSASATLTYNQDHLTNTFASNLQFFEQNLPHIYKAFANYQAGPNKLGIDDSEQLNITCGNGWLYSKSIQALVHKQLKDFQNNCPSLQMTNSTITKTLEEVINIFSSMGFVVAEGPDIVTDFNKGEINP